LPAARSATRRPDVAAENPRREAILNAAFTLLMQRGYERTSTLDIATRAKVSKRELYQLFHDKQAILAACISARARRMHRPLDLPSPQDGATLRTVLNNFGSTLLREMCHPAVIAVYRLAAIEAERSPEVARTLDTAGREANRVALLDLFARAQASHVLVQGDASAMASEFFGLLLGDVPLRLILRVAAPPSSEEIDRRAQVAADALLRLHGTDNPR
jgi:AcrR family transcriptional regulator